MPKDREGGTTPSPNRRGQPDQAHADAAAPGTDTGHLLVLVSGARAAVREALSAQVVLLLPGARAHAASPKDETGARVHAASPKDEPGARVHAAGPKDETGATPCRGRCNTSAMPAAPPLLVVRLAGDAPAVPPGWEDAPLAEVRPRDVDGERAPAHASGYADLADVALALARCGQLRRVADTGVPSGQRLSGAALIAAMPEVLRPLLPGVWRTAEALVGQAGDALHARDMVLLARVGHTMRGMAANYAMPEWAACAAALECAANCADMDAASDSLAWLRAALTALSGLPDLSGLPGLPGQSGQSVPSPVGAEPDPHD
ncbi:Hpt domain-containing protein [Nitratidesulfovibrio sp. SRB-5]|uniref:Hpt domain-containing protein n=1 Tax=Nitratidesulfovibrio sp. SRB-5 TaxID=2872636 RepID=UPI001CBD686F|nr:Hpt domain-containing protein [Nitratidesulfovibrio sp. SRB-5]MBZ2173500.1 Hpt domain-containing protein [Nitratidesulfovibrio sp. SRB-5]